MRSRMRRASRPSICARARAGTGRDSAAAVGECGKRSTCQISAAASSRALSVPWPKCSRARASRCVLRLSTAATLSRGGALCDNRAMNRRSILLLLSLGAAAIVAGALLARLFSGAVPLTSGTWLPRARPLAEFHLLDLSGRDFTREDLRGHPTLLFFGFTNCPDVCPTTLAMLAQLQRQPPLPGAQVVFVSIDLSLIHISEPTRQAEIS